MAEVVVENLRKTFRDSEGNEVVAVEDVSFEVEQNELFTLLGPSGCGKTTTLRCIAGLEQIDGGEIRIAGEVVSSAEKDIAKPPEERDAGLIYQSYALWPHMTASENLEYVLKGRDYPSEKIDDRIDELFEIVGMPGVGDRYPDQLSGGQQQRVAFARAIAYEPALLLMDEPLSNLDVKLRREMRQNLLEILDNIETTAVYVTHDQHEAFELSDRVTIMNQGTQEQTGVPTDVYYQPTNEYVAEFLGEANILDVEILDRQGDTATCNLLDADMEIQALSSDRDTFEDPAVVIRPENIELADGSGNGTNNYAGQTVREMFRGTHTKYIVDMSGAEVGLFTDRPILDQGQSIQVEIAPDDAYLIDRYAIRGT